MYGYSITGSLGCLDGTQSIWCRREAYARRALSGCVQASGCSTQCIRVWHRAHAYPLKAQGCEMLLRGQGLVGHVMWRFGTPAAENGCKSCTGICAPCSVGTAFVCALVVATAKHTGWNVRCSMYGMVYSSRGQPRPNWETGLVPAIRYAGVPSPLAVRKGPKGNSYISNAVTGLKVTLSQSVLAPHLPQRHTRRPQAAPGESSTPVAAPSNLPGGTGYETAVRGNSPAVALGP